MVNDDLATELATMQAIASALGRLDFSARTRVLHWLQARFDPTAPVASLAVPAPVALRVVPSHVSASDEMLSVEALTDLFPALAARTTGPATVPVTAMLTEFVAEFQDLAREWDGACSAAAEAHRAARILPAAS